jgi:hypothetical protein
MHQHDHPFAAVRGQIHTVWQVEDTAVHAYMGSINIQFLRASWPCVCCKLLRFIHCPHCYHLTATFGVKSAAAGLGFGSQWRAQEGLKRPLGPTGLSVFLQQRQPGAKLSSICWQLHCCCWSFSFTTASAMYTAPRFCCLRRVCCCGIWLPAIFFQCWCITQALLGSVTVVFLGCLLPCFYSL